jgi:DnaJ-class molecular chaperone
MENINYDIINNLIEKNIDLFLFMNLDPKYTSDYVIFTDKYHSALKRAYKRNSIKYHPDKCINASEIEKNDLEHNFNLNQIIYTILSSRKSYEEFNECKQLLSCKSHQSLKSSFTSENHLSNNNIKQLIKEASNGKTFKQLSDEKDKLHGLDQFVNKTKLTYGKTDEHCSSVSVPTKVGRKTELTYSKTSGHNPEVGHKTDEQSSDVSKLYNTILSERENMYNEILKNTKKIEINDNNSFNSQFESLIDKKSINNSYEIVAFNESNNGIITNTFDYQQFDYSDLYVKSNDEYENLFKLLSTDISTYVDDKLSLEDKIKQYNKNTIELNNMVMKHN